MSNGTSVLEAFGRDQEERRQEQLQSELRAALKRIPAGRRETEIAAALAAIAAEARRKELLDAYGEMSTDELERRLAL